MYKKLVFVFLLTTLTLLSNSIEDEVYELSDFIVTDSEDKGYYSANSTSITKSNELIKNTPVNLSIINEELLEDLGINFTEDLAQVSSSIDTDPTSYSTDQIRIRGFRNTWARYNGVRRNLPKDGYNISRYDIIKGANSLIFGQASPGGSVNAIPLIANFRKDAGSFLISKGNKDFNRKIFNYNWVLADNLAVRYMHLDHYQGYEHDYKSFDIKSQTLLLNYLPTNDSSLRVHIEKVDSKTSFPTLAMRDVTYADDSSNDDTMTTGEKYDGYLSVEDNSDQLYDFHVPFSPDWVNFAPQGMIDNLITHTQNNIDPTKVNGSLTGINILNRETLRNYYSSIDESNYGYQSGPDKNKQVDGIFGTIDYQKILSNDLELSVTLNYQENEGVNLGRDLDGITRIRDSYTFPSASYPRTHEHLYHDVNENGLQDIFEPQAVSPELYIKTNWIKSEAEAKRGGAKATFLLEKSIGNIENKFLLGLDYDYIDKEQINFDQTPSDALNPDGSYLAPYVSSIFERSKWVSNNQITDREKAFEYIMLSKGFGPDRSIIRFNDVIESDFAYSNTGPFASLPPGTTGTGYRRNDANSNNFVPNNSLFTSDGDTAVRDTPAIWSVNTKLSAKIKTKSLWTAAQSSFLDGRFRTLLGFRFDSINVHSRLRKVSLFGFEDLSTLVIEDNIRVNNAENKTYDEFSPSIGGLYWVNKDIGIFANYAESIETPTGQDRTPIGTLAPPELGKGVELGLRFSDASSKIDGQIAYYSIEKENDNEFRYTDNQLYEIYPGAQKDENGVFLRDENNDPILTEYGIDFPEIYNSNGTKLLKSSLPGRRGVGDVTLSEGFEIDVNYNPTSAITIIGSFNKNINNKILELDEQITNPGQYELFGRPKYRASITGKYSIRSGLLKGLSGGLTQQYRSGSNQSKFTFNFDENGDLTQNLDEVSSTETYYLKYGAEHNTIAFMSYNGKFGKDSNKINYQLNFRVNNLFDKRDFVSRGNYGFYRESRSYNISTKILF